MYPRRTRGYFFFAFLTYIARRPRTGLCRRQKTERFGRLRCSEQPHCSKRPRRSEQPHCSERPRCSKRLRRSEQIAVGVAALAGARQSADPRVCAAAAAAGAAGIADAPAGPGRSLRLRAVLTAAADILLSALALAVLTAGAAGFHTGTLPEVVTAGVDLVGLQCE